MKPVRGHDGVFEMTWAANGRATFAYGEEQSAGQARLAASAADTSPRNTDNTTCNFRSGVLFAELDISISLHQTQPRPEQETLTRDSANTYQNVLLSAALAESACWSVPLRGVACRGVR